MDITQYQPKDHIQHLEIAPRSEGVFDQREITIQSYQTTVPFDYAQFDACIESAWLTPQIRFGVFSRTPPTDKNKQSLNVILGLQDELSVRAYDYDNRIPIYFSWKDLVVDTVSIHFFCDEDGLLRFTTTGGGRKITDDLLYEFNSSFLKIPKNAVSKRHFDLDKLRELCFGDFRDRLYMLKFSDPSGEEYRSIDHAQFQSRKYIDPQAERLKEIQKDPTVKVESFDSDIEFHADILAQIINVRFFIRGLSGSLRLRLPKVRYKHEYKTVDEQTHAFYKLVDTAVNCILDADYYTHQKRSLEDLSGALGVLSPDFVDLTPFREAFISDDVRQKFFDSLELDGWNHWQPHMRALNELISSDAIKSHVEELLNRLITGEPLKAGNLLLECCNDALLKDIGVILARSCAGKHQLVQAKHRPHIEESILAWAVVHEQNAWNIILNRGEIEAFGIPWKPDDLSPDVLAKLLWKLIGIFHDRLVNNQGDIPDLLAKFHWCVKWVRTLHANIKGLPSAFKMVAEDKLPKTVIEGDKILKQRVETCQELDDAVLDQFGLPLWPLLVARFDTDKIILTNEGIGSALSVGQAQKSSLFDDEDTPEPVDILPGDSIEIPCDKEKQTKITVTFSKFGTRYTAELPIVQGKATKKTSKKTASRDNIVGELKREIHNQILAQKNAIRNADDHGNAYKLPQITQKQLAQIIGSTESAVSRAFSKSNDRELQIMFETLQSVNQIRKYSTQ